jgi:pyridoxal phosphate enzyme (YggS family)
VLRYSSAMLDTSRIQDNYQSVLERVASACRRAGRSHEDVLLLPVSKLHPPSAIEAIYALGVRDFGESRVQELLKKRESLPPDIRWHFIGNLQSNKVRQIADVVHIIHSVHSRSLAEELARRAQHELQVLIEVNISGESSKSGVAAPEAEVLLNAIERHYPNLKVVGLMGMASFEDDPERTRLQFRALRSLHDNLRQEHSAIHELSMGMTNDFEVAIEEGATIVRVGSAIFGERT